MRTPSIEVLTHRSEHDAEEPAFKARNPGVVETGVEFLAFDGAFGTGASVGMQLPEQGIASQPREQAIVLLGIGVNGAPVGGIGTLLREVWAGRQGLMLCGEWAAPFEAKALRTKALIDHRLLGHTDRYSGLGESQRGRELEMVGIPFVQRDNRVELPVFHAEPIEGHGIMGFI